VIHDDLIRHFEGRRAPELSPDFAMNLRRQLRAEPQPGIAPVILRWAPRLYWIIALAVLTRYWRPVMLTPTQMLVLATVGAAVLLTLRWAVRPGPLPRILREALWR
jgi:hypothetical protein